MNIMFMTRFPDGTETNFKEKILLGLCIKSGWNMDEEKISPKLHTIRASKRVKVGMKLKLCNWEGKAYRSKVIGFADAVCLATQDIKIEWENHGAGNNGKEMIAPVVWIDGEMFYAPFWGEGSIENLVTLAINDGFDNPNDFLDWFKDGFEGQIIHWTNLKY